MTSPFFGVHRTRTVVFLIALLVYLPAFWWGAPSATAPERKHAWGTDDETPLGPLAEIHNIIEPKPDRNLGYPLMYSFIAATAYSPYLGYLMATGELQGISGEYPFGLRNPVDALKVLTWIAHFITVVMGCGVVLAAFVIGQTIWDKRTGVLSALFAGTSLPMFYYSRTGNVDVPMLCFLALAGMVFSRICVMGLTVKRSIWLGIFAGFAIATKESAVGFLIPIPLMVLNSIWQNHKSIKSIMTWDALRSPMLGLLASLLALGLGSGFFVDPGRYIDHINFISGRLESLSSGGLPVVLTFPYTFDGHLAYAKQIVIYLGRMMTWPGLILALAGFTWLGIKRPKEVFMGFMALSYALFIFMVLRSGQMRYLLPIPFGLSFYAARAVFLAWETQRWPVRAVSSAAATFALGVNLVFGVQLTYEMVNDSRFAASDWLAKQMVPGDRLEFFGPTDKLPWLPENVVVERANEYRGMYVKPRIDEMRVEEIQRELELRNTRFILTIPDFTSKPGMPYSASCPPKFFSGLMNGSMGYYLAVSFKTPTLFSWLKRPKLDYPTVNPEIRIFMREDSAAH